MSDLIGYINNKKGFASVTTGGTTVSYTLATKTVDTGKQLIIRTHKGTDGLLQESQTFVPQLPYRFILNDPSFFENNKYKLYDFTNVISLYNPGIHAADKIITMPTSFLTGTSPFIEINLPRSCISFMKGAYRYQSLPNSCNVDVNVYTIKAYDLQASMVVESVDSTHDNLIITVCSRVDLGLNYTSLLENCSDHWYYTIPVTVLIQIDRSTLTTTSIKTQDIIPFSWTYPIDYHFDNNSAGQINSSVVGDIETQMWNYNILPGKYYALGLVNYRYTLNSFGCIADTAYDGVSGYVTITSMGNYVPAQKSFRQIHSVNLGTLDISGFNLTTLYNWNYKTSEVAAKNSIIKVGTYYITTQDTYNNLNRNSNFMILGSSMSLLAQVQFGTKVFYVDLFERVGTAYLTFCSETKQYVYKFPVITVGIIATLGLDKVLTVEGFKNLLVSIGCTLLSETGMASNPSSTLVYNLKASDGTDLKYYIDGSKQDKSINYDMNAHYGEDYNLKMIGTSCLVMDKINQYANAQLNNLQYIKV